MRPFEAPRGVVEPILARIWSELLRIERIGRRDHFHLAWAQVLARTSGRDDVLFGTALIGRLHGGAGADRATGLFINTLPLRIRLGQATVRQAVRDTHENLARLMLHEHVSLALAQRCMRAARDSVVKIEQAGKQRLCRRQSMCCSNGTPRAQAPLHGALEVTYGALNQAANRLARQLIGHGVVAGQPVALALERSVDLVVAQLAVLKCGAFYVPLDRNAPAAPCLRGAGLCGQWARGRRSWTTALFDQFTESIPQALAGLRYLLCGGERSDAGAFARQLAHGGSQQLIHCYGPTETTTFATTWK